MRTPGVVRWFDGRTGLGAVVLSNSGLAQVARDRLVRRVPSEFLRECCTVDRGAAAAGSRGWRHLWPDITEAARAGTWGDAGRDY